MSANVRLSRKSFYGHSYLKTCPHSFGISRFRHGHSGSAPLAVPCSEPRMSLTPYESSNRRAQRIGAVPCTPYPDQERNVPKFPTISHFPQKTSKTGAVHPTRNFILHPSYFILCVTSFVADFGPQLLPNFSPTHAMRVFGSTPPGVETSPLSSRSPQSLACGMKRLPWRHTEAVSSTALNGRRMAPS